MRKTARFFESIEREDCVLQIEEDLQGLKIAGEEGYPEREVGTVFYLLERIFEDVNAFGECCVQLPGWGMSTLNLRFEECEEEGVAARVRSWDVPVLIRGLPAKEEWTWDLALERVGGFVDGIRHVGKIAEVADVEVKLVKRCVRELVLLKRAMVLDIFHFGAIYTCTSRVVEFVRDEGGMQAECAAYVAVPSPPKPNHEKDNDNNPKLPSKEILIDLYTSLQPGIPLRDFCLDRAEVLANIDIRRFITFGIIKGFLRRIHKFALSTEISTYNSTTPLEKKRSGGGGSSSTRYSGDEAVREMDRAWRKAALSSGWATPPQGPPPTLMAGSGSLGGMKRTEGEMMQERLMGYLDGGWPLERACVEMGVSEKGFLERVRGGRCGEVVLFNK